MRVGTGILSLCDHRAIAFCLWASMFLPPLPSAFCDHDSAVWLTCVQCTGRGQEKATRSTQPCSCACRLIGWCHSFWQCIRQNNSKFRLPRAEQESQYLPGWAPECPGMYFSTLPDWMRQSAHDLVRPIGIFPWGVCAIERYLCFALFPWATQGSSLGVSLYCLGWAGSSFCPGVLTPRS